MHGIGFDSKWLGGLLLALYVSLSGCATPPKPAPETVQAAAKAVTATPVVAAGIAPASSVAAAPVVTGVVAEPAPVVVAAPAAVPGAVGQHIALILPLQSPVFGKAAEAVQQGFMAAAVQANGLPVRTYPCNNEKYEVAALYQQALKAGAVAVAGPLTQPGVAALVAIQDMPVTTLALNVVEMPRSDALYFFGLPPESEARQVAQWSTRQGLLSATIVRTDSVLSKRLAQAFADSWKRAGGIVQSEIVYGGDPLPLRLIPADPGNMVFLAAESAQARLIRPYINMALPIYATSQAFAGNGSNLVNYDLAEVRFVDMPWVVQPDHPAVMIYAHASPPLPHDMERLYALGVDAYRLLQVLYQHDMSNALPLDGVTGKLRLNGHVVEREAVLSVMREGQGLAMDYKPPVDPKTLSTGEAKLPAESQPR